MSSHSEGVASTGRWNLHVNEDGDDSMGDLSLSSSAQDTTLEKIRYLFFNVVAPLHRLSNIIFAAEEDQSLGDLKYPEDLLQISPDSYETFSQIDETEFNETSCDQLLESSALSLDPSYQVLQVTPEEPNSKLSVGFEEPPARPERCSTLVPCRYASSGCREMVNPCTVSEMNHMKSCRYRPLECIVGGCEKDVPCHSFLIHLNQHFIYPIYGHKLTTSVVISIANFESGGTWLPKWLSVQNRHFFVMLRRFDHGLWASWVWTFGDDGDAEGFVSRISCFKNFKCITGVHPVHSIRKKQEEIAKSEQCLLISDDTMKAFTGIEQKLVADMAFNVQIIDKAESQTPQNKDVEDEVSTVSSASTAVSITPTNTETSVMLST